MNEPLSAEVHALLTLHVVPGLGPRLTAALLERFGSAEAVLQASPHELCEVPHIGAELARKICEAIRRADIQAELSRMSEHSVRLLALGTPDYPAALSKIPDPPHLLYVAGSLVEKDTNAVAVVGSRHGTAYGKRIAERLATELVHAGHTVVSGLARGIDAAAHRAALKAGGRTLAVLAGGLSRIYPPEHRELADEVRTAGALLSESAMPMEPLAVMFPARNRIISGLSRAVVIIEAAEKSGALITARHAAEQGRVVFAVPGPVDSPASSGTNALIRNGAILVRSVDDILEELDGVAPLVEKPQQPAPANPPAGLDLVQQRIWEFLADGPRHGDELAQQLGLSVPQIAGALLGLEMRKAIRRLPGNRYERS
jgi:DNA processing protein